MKDVYCSSLGTFGLDQNAATERYNLYMSESNFPLPPATFEFLVLSLKMQTEMQLGLLHFGDEKEKEQPNLEAARHSIDMLAMIQEKTVNNLSLEEKRLLDNSLTELRFRCVQVSETPAKETPAQS